MAMAQGTPWLPSQESDVITAAVIGLFLHAPGGAQTCLAGPGAVGWTWATVFTCLDMDFDEDADVDLADYALFVVAYHDRACRFGLRPNPYSNTIPCWCDGAD